MEKVNESGDSLSGLPKISGSGIHSDTLPNPIPLDLSQEVWVISESTVLSATGSSSLFGNRN